jgi:hypothetical protein
MNPAIKDAFNRALQGSLAECKALQDAIDRNDFQDALEALDELVEFNKMILRHVERLEAI